MHNQTPGKVISKFLPLKCDTNATGLAWGSWGCVTSHVKSPFSSKWLVGSPRYLISCKAVKTLRVVKVMSQSVNGCYVAWGGISSVHCNWLISHHVDNLLWLMMQYKICTLFSSNESPFSRRYSWTAESSSEELALICCTMCLWSVFLFPQCIGLCNLCYTELHTLHCSDYMCFVL